MTGGAHRPAPTQRRRVPGPVRWRGFLVVLLALAVAAAVALILAQSAGAIHLRILG